MINWIIAALIVTINAIAWYWLGRSHQTSGAFEIDDDDCDLIETAAREDGMDTAEWIVHTAVSAARFRAGRRA